MMKMDKLEDRAIAELISAVAEQYHSSIEEGSQPIKQIRLEIIRKLELIRQSIKGLMKDNQKKLLR
jgi:hypothetical protein